MWYDWLGAGLALLAICGVNYVVQRYRIRRANLALIKRGDIWLDQQNYDIKRTAQDAERKAWRASGG